MLFHAFPGTLPGGFTGVDVFFVISGYLITGIILGELDSDDFTFSGFWIRRARRILPAMLFMFALVTAAAFYLLMPTEMIQYGAMLAASVSFLANMQLSQDNGYFDPGFLDNPLLHVWSLAVEEQYYLIWPVLSVALASRFGRRTFLAAAVLLGLASLAFSQWAVFHSPQQGFFGLPSRAFELMIGGVLAIANPRALASRLAVNLLAGVGAALILAGIVFLGASTPFPGGAALLPCIGTALVIYAGMGRTPSVVGQVLGSAPLVAVGRISYSWYLWHWPPIAFVHYYYGRPLTGGELFAMLALGLALAIVSYFLIERPFRKASTSTLFIPRRVQALAAISVIFLGIGGAIFASDGLTWRLSPEGQAAYRLFVRAKPLRRCSDEASIDSFRRCPFGLAGAAVPSTLLWGDSHGSHYLPAIGRIAESYGLKGLVRLTNGCQPIGTADFANANPQRRDRCRRNNQETLAYLRAHPEIRIVILAGRWSYRYEPTTVEADLALLTKDLDATLQMLRGMGKTVLLLGEVPKLANDTQGCVLKQIEFGVVIPNCGSVEVASLDPLGAAIWGSFERLRSVHPDLTIFEPQKQLCDGQRCRALDDEGKPLYRDNNHLNPRGAEFIEPALRQAIQRVIGAPVTPAPRGNPS